MPDTHSVDLIKLLSRDELMFGRRDIYTSYDYIDAENVIQAVNEALSYHLENFMDEDYLYWRRRGISPVLVREKERNAFINNKVIENHPDEIVSFKNGFMLPQPAFYVAREEGKQSAVDTLNEILRTSGKQDADNEIVDWFHTVGKGALLVLPTGDRKKPIVCYSMDPRSAFVVYSMQPGKEPVMGINMVTVNGRVRFDVYTKYNVFRLSGGEIGPMVTEIPVNEATAISIDAIEDNIIGEIPIAEYRYNSVNMGAFEGVLTICTALDKIASNRLDGLEQFIQSLIVTYNVEFEGNVTAEDIRRMGIVPLKSTSDSKGDIKILSEELNQSQTQTLADHLYDQMLTICMMPSNRKGGASTSDTGAASLYRDGWVQAETCASNCQDLFRKSNKQFDRIVCKILRLMGIADLEPDDFELTFNRTEMANIQSKAQSLNTLLASGVAPVLALAKSGVSNDPQSDYTLSKKYMDMIWGDPDEVEKAKELAMEQGSALNPEQQAQTEEGEATVIEEERATDQPEDGGDV